MCLSVVIALAAFVAEPEILGPLLGVRVGLFIIEGNTDTPDQVVHDHLDDLRPGMKVGFGSIREARRRLRACRSFQNNPWRGIGPVVELQPPGFESEFWDVRIRVVDRPGSWLGYSLTNLLRAAAYTALLLDLDAAQTVRWELEYIADRVRRESHCEP